MILSQVFSGTLR